MLSQPVGYFFLWSINGTFKSFVGVMLGFGCVSFFGIAGAARSTGAVVPTGFTIGAGENLGFEYFRADAELYGQ